MYVGRPHFWPHSSGRSRRNQIQKKKTRVYRGTSRDTSGGEKCEVKNFRHALSPPLLDKTLHAQFALGSKLEAKVRDDAVVTHSRLAMLKERQQAAKALCWK